MTIKEEQKTNKLRYLINYVLSTMPLISLFPFLSHSLSSHCIYLAPTQETESQQQNLLSHSNLASFFLLACYKWKDGKIWWRRNWRASESNRAILDKLFTECVHSWCLGNWGSHRWLSNRATASESLPSHQLTFLLHHGNHVNDFTHSIPPLICILISLWIACFRFNYWFG